MFGLMGRRKKFVKKARGFFDNKPSAGKLTAPPSDPPPGPPFERLSTLATVQHPKQPHGRPLATPPAGPPFERLSTLATVQHPKQPHGRPLATPPAEPIVTQTEQPIVKRPEQNSPLPRETRAVPPPCLPPGPLFETPSTSSVVQQSMQPHASPAATTPGESAVTQVVVPPDARAGPPSDTSSTPPILKGPEPLDGGPLTSPHVKPTAPQAAQTIGQHSIQHSAPPPGTRAAPPSRTSSIPPIFRPVQSLDWKPSTKLPLEPDAGQIGQPLANHTSKLAGRPEATRPGEPAMTQVVQAHGEHAGQSSALPAETPAVSSSVTPSTAPIAKRTELLDGGPSTEPPAQPGKPPARSIPGLELIVTGDFLRTGRPSNRRRRSIHFPEMLLQNFFCGSSETCPRGNWSLSMSSVCFIPPTARCLEAASATS
jgi:hypothetical protein